MTWSDESRVDEGAAGLDYLLVLGAFVDAGFFVVFDVRWEVYGLNVDEFILHGLILQRRRPSPHTPIYIFHMHILRPRRYHPYPFFN
tara:strand:- start:655 stop:915 length:261 start_codon:yes stop_codon:yes gene_type:complete